MVKEESKKHPINVEGFFKILSVCTPAIFNLDDPSLKTWAYIRTVIKSAMPPPLGKAIESWLPDLTCVSVCPKPTASVRISRT